MASKRGLSSGCAAIPVMKPESCLEEMGCVPAVSQRLSSGFGPPFLCCSLCQSVLLISFHLKCFGLKWRKKDKFVQKSKSKASNDYLQQRVGLMFLCRSNVFCRISISECKLLLYSSLH